MLSQGSIFRVLERTRFCFEILFIILVAILLFALFRPEPPPDLFSNSDKVGHVLIFLAITVSGRLTRWQYTDLVYWPLWMVLGVGLEYLQGLLRPLRIFSVEDALANLAGVGIGLVLWLIIRRMRTRDRIA